MSLDGFSLSSLGLPKDITSAQAAAAAEQLAQRGLENKISTISKANEMKISDEDSKKDKSNKNLKDEEFQDGFEDNEDNDDGSDENEKAKSGKPSRKSRRKFILKDTENLTIRFNEGSETVELYNKITNRTIETIKAQDLIEIISKLDYTSGILVNKKI